MFFSNITLKQGKCFNFILPRNKSSQLTGTTKNCCAKTTNILLFVKVSYYRTSENVSY